MLAVPFVTGCPQQFVGMLEDMDQPDSTDIQNHLKRYLSSGQTFESLRDYADSLAAQRNAMTNNINSANNRNNTNTTNNTPKSGNAVKGTRGDSTAIEAEEPLKILFDFTVVDDSHYPDSIVILANVHDNHGKYITGLAPPYFTGKGDYHNYWQSLVDSCRGAANSIGDFQVTEFRESEAEKHALVFVLDHSSSMGDKRARKLQEAVNFISFAIKKTDYFSVIRFTSIQTVEIPLTNDNGLYRNKIKVDGLKGDYGDGTRIASGVLAGIEELKKTPPGYRKNIILFTDGADGDRKPVLESALKELKKENIAVYSIAYGLANESYLKAFCNVSGGKFYRIYSSTEFPFVFKDIYLSMKNYYRIAYRPPECAGKHSVSIKLNLGLPDLNAPTAGGEYDRSIFTKYDEVGKITFFNIQFEFGKADLKPESDSIIANVAESMKNNPDMKIEIRGHTDDVGDENYNLNLSRKRAEAVRKRLIELGVAPAKLTAAGLGETAPLVPNTDDESRRKNRRTEFVIIAN